MTQTIVKNFTIFNFLFFFIYVIVHIFIVIFDNIAKRFSLKHIIVKLSKKRVIHLLC